MPMTGEEHISAAQLSLCRRAATLEIKLEELESEMSRIDVGLNRIDLYSRSALPSPSQSRDFPRPYSHNGD
jgi:hypothetical protein